MADGRWAIIVLVFVGESRPVFFGRKKFRYFVGELEL